MSLRTRQSVAADVRRRRTWKLGPSASSRRRLQSPVRNASQTFRTLIMKNLRTSMALLAAAFAGLGGGSESRAATVSEPETIFYGRIINRLSGQTYVLQEGALTWRIRRSNGTLVTLATELQPLKGGVYSYRLNVPHQALGLGLNSSTSVVPLSAQPTTCIHEQISVDGFPAVIL